MSDRLNIQNSRYELLDESERTRTEVWTRVMGYHRPVSAFNPGKQSEHAERKFFKEFHLCQNSSKTSN